MEMRMMKEWRLKRGNVVLGTLSELSIDQPFGVYRFEPTPDFEGVRPLFDEELRLLNTRRSTSREWEEASERIEGLGLTLVSPDEAQIIDDFLLHIDGDRAWFRY
jgi:hypothetical protein